MREWDSIPLRAEREGERSISSMKTKEKQIALLVQSKMKVFDDLNVTMN